ncbi:MAG: hypothetical protein KC635_14330, partial [Myxococcales bacterium]|nr:hypothetical protein [Myxococcales bacterium]
MSGGTPARVLRGPLRAGLVAAAVLAIATAVGAVLAPSAFFNAWLVAWLLWLGVALGGLAILCVHHLVHGRWGRSVRPLLEAVARTVPLLAVAFVPLALGLAHVYPWTDDAFMASDPLRVHKAAYLAATPFLLRSAAALVLWSVLAWLLTRDPSRLRPGLAAATLIAYFLGITTGGVDWVLSLEPSMSTSAFGLALATGHGAAGLAFVLVLAAWLGRRARPPVEADRAHDLGNVLLAAVMLWAYIAFTQMLLVWAADIPRQSGWYLERSEGLWNGVSWALIALHFAAPFLLLLFRVVKRRPARLAGVAALVLVLHAVEV